MPLSSTLNAGTPEMNAAAAGVANDLTTSSVVGVSDGPVLAPSLGGPVSRSKSISTEDEPLTATKTMSVCSGWTAALTRAAEGETQRWTLSHPISARITGRVPPPDLGTLSDSDLKKSVGPIATPPIVILSGITLDGGAKPLTVHAIR